MNDLLFHLQRLQIELHSVNEEFASAARPLKQLSALNDEQKQRVAEQLRACQRRWEAISQQASLLFRREGAGRGNSWM